jgi:hypothetical protein
MFTVVSIKFLGDALRDLLDVRSSKGPGAHYHVVPVAIRAAEIAKSVGIIPSPDTSILSSGRRADAPSREEPPPPGKPTPTQL